MSKKATVIMSDADVIAVEVVKRRYGQQSDAGVFRMCVHMVAMAKEIVLESPMVDLKN